MHWTDAPKKTLPKGWGALNIILPNKSVLFRLYHPLSLSISSSLCVRVYISGRGAPSSPSEAPIIESPVTLLHTWNAILRSKPAVLKHRLYTSFLASLSIHTTGTQATASSILALIMLLCSWFLCLFFFILCLRSWSRRKSIQSACLAHQLTIHSVVEGWYTGLLKENISWWFTSCCCSQEAKIIRPNGQ